MSFALRLAGLFIAATLLMGCGTDSTPSLDASIPTGLSPYVNRVDPASGVAGDTIVVYGFGFSSASANNIVTVGGVSVSANAYSLLATPVQDELESITFIVPGGVGIGDSTIFVTVLEEVSNANVAFTVTN